MNKPLLLLTGSSGLVGKAVQPLLSDWDVLAPKRTELNLLSSENIQSYLQNYKPSHILHVAAFVNAGEAEEERGNKQGLTWRTNVKATSDLVTTAHEYGAFVCYLSTGSVFHGTKEKPGPFKEEDPPEKEADHNNWYGFTKYMGECANPDSIVRISHPVVPNGRDYLHKMRELYEDHNLHPLFFDQLFPLTSIVDLACSLDLILKNKQQGIYHVASTDVVSPYELFTTLVPESKEYVKKISIEDFHKQGNSPLRFAQYAAIDSHQSEKKLGLSFTSWKAIINNL